MLHTAMHCMLQMPLAALTSGERELARAAGVGVGMAALGEVRWAVMLPPELSMLDSSPGGGLCRREVRRCLE